MLLECCILKLFVLKNFIMLEDVGSITFCYTLEGFMSLGDFDFIKLVNSSCDHIQDKIHKHKF